MYRKFISGLVCFICSLFLTISFGQSNALKDCIIENAISTLGYPYVEGTLETEEDEKLIWYTNRFDCVTLVDWILALSLYQTQQAEHRYDFEHWLQAIRYRKGEIRGYESRIHYYSEWILQNSDFPFLTNITESLGGVYWQGKISFMTQNRLLYPELKKDIIYHAIKQTENTLNQKSWYYIPKNKVSDIEHLIESGDIIAITTSVPGLDISHVGIALEQKSKMHLLHASSEKGKVIISEKTLSNYLKSNKSQTGIIVIRPGW